MRVLRGAGFVFGCLWGEWGIVSTLGSLLKALQRSSIVPFWGIQVCYIFSLTILVSVVLVGILETSGISR